MMLVFIKDYVDIMGVEDIVTAGTLGIILLLTLIVFVLLCWMTPQLASALTGGGAIQGSMRTVYNIARKGLSKTDTGIRKISNSLGGKKGGSIKKS